MSTVSPEVVLKERLTAFPPSAKSVGASVASPSASAKVPSTYTRWSLYVSLSILVLNGHAPDALGSAGTALAGVANLGVFAVPADVESLEVHDELLPGFHVAVHGVFGHADDDVPAVFAVAVVLDDDLLADVAAFVVTDYHAVDLQVLLNQGITAVGDGCSVVGLQLCDGDDVVEVDGVVPEFVVRHGIPVAVLARAHCEGESHREDGKCQM